MTRESKEIVKTKKANNDKIQFLKTRMQMIKQQRNKRIFTSSCDCGSHPSLVLHLKTA